MNQKAEQLSTGQTITRQPLTGSRKIYVPGQLHDIDLEQALPHLRES